jgi:hypothetical protein
MVSFIIEAGTARDPKWDLAFSDLPEIYIPQRLVLSGAEPSLASSMCGPPPARALSVV